MLKKDGANELATGGLPSALWFSDVSIDVGDDSSKRTILHNVTGRFESERLVRARSVSLRWPDFASLCSLQLWDPQALASRHA